jgi:hypothetical protein
MLRLFLSSVVVFALSVGFLRADDKNAKDHKAKHGPKGDHHEGR